MNKMILSGNLANMVTKKHLNNGMCVAQSTLALNNVIKKKDGSKENEVCYIDVIAYEKIAKLMYEYTTKGTKILIEGKLKQDVWQDNSGNTKSKHYIIIKRLEVLNNKTQQSSQTSPTFKSTKP
ncbi:single-stranded DNA-binding protein [Helicobacter trogontum]|uniref:Single-stranded DNA-binding protein n=1 Tax=Helicobacter trogontum TaxID=50960 RepID=A0A4U8SER3_9HELI|nr:single-stranded DNA-binding protein [Helicobacter trogontum]TLD84679.1 single-stranded DNA-binding protein [Helicobacter trogontum]